LARDRRVQDGPTLADFWGAPQDEEEESMLSARPARKPAVSEITISPNA
jgi:anaerobic magnesium-protoporphyrin IX monomethyl ester cyclase